MYLPFAFDMSFYGLSLFSVFYGLDWIASVPPTVRLLSNAVGVERIGIMVAWITVIHQFGGAFAAYLAGAAAHRFRKLPRSLHAGGHCLHRRCADGAVHRFQPTRPRAGGGLGVPINRHLRLAVDPRDTTKSADEETGQQRSDCSIMTGWLDRADSRRSGVRARTAQVDP